MSKKLVLSLLAVIMVSASVLAQGGQRRSVEDRVKAQMERLADLKMTAEQSTKMSATLTTFHKGIDALRTGEGRPDMAKFQELRTKRDESVKGFLDEAQLEKYKTIITEMEQRRRGGGAQQPQGL